MELKSLVDLRMKRLIMLILVVLTAVFLVGMLLMSSLNLDFSQRAMAELRQKQITDIVQANLNRINAHHQLMEQNTASLANIGELLYLNRGSNTKTTREALQTNLTRALEKCLRRTVRKSGTTGRVSHYKTSQHTGTGPPA